MCVEFGTSYKPFVTFNTDVGSVSAVISLMYNERRSLGKSFTTFVAGVFSFARMSDIVSSEQTHGGEAFATNFTSKWFLTGVNPPVYLHARQACYLLAAQVAQKKLLFSAAILFPMFVLFVPVVQRFVREILAAYFARIFLN